MAVVLVSSSKGDESCKAEAYRDYVSALEACGGSSGPSTEWECETKVENRSGTLDIGRCKGNDKIACYEDIKESCREKHTGQTMSKSYRSFTGVCAGSFSDCW